MESSSARTAPTAGFHDLAKLSATDLLEGYRSGRFTPRDVVEDVIAALEITDAMCNVVVTPTYEQARAAADRATEAWRAGQPQGRLAGVPVTIKDLVFVAGVPALGGAPSNRGFVPDANAAVVAALEADGAIVTCKTTTCESGYKLTADSPVSGITRNPWNKARTSGGSSGGAAAAVAAGCGPLAIGTDGVGSIRVPSSFCGVVGLKPTFGLVPRSPGFSPPSWASLAHTGPIARTVADAALLLEVIASHDIRDAASLPVASRSFTVTLDRLDGLRIGTSVDFGYAAVDPQVRDAFEAASKMLATLGAEIVPDCARLAPDMLERILKPIAYTEQAAAVANRDSIALSASDEDYRDVIAKGRSYSGIDYVEASYRRAGLRASFLELFGKVDALVTPTVAVTAFCAGALGVDQIADCTVDRHLGWSPFSWPINLTGLPAVTIPCGFDDSGLPIGLQIVAPWLDEGLILRIAAAFERARPWVQFRPPLS
ncbi:amidase [Bradyrhizobium australiense]|uniref:amidase n=1 Tax=Bradyrhizobium australiense TaxID=2721161 RepID=UPI0028A12451|nr:amidase family protein [Bradyrhizobium australiense]